jgi:hypothetical protein
LHRQRGCNATDKALRTTPAAPSIAGHVPAGLLAHSGMTLLSSRGFVCIRFNSNFDGLTLTGERLPAESPREPGHAILLRRGNVVATPVE